MSASASPLGPAMAVQRSRIVGIDQLAPLLGGSMRPYVNLDNAASTGGGGFRRGQHAEGRALLPLAKHVEDEAAGFANSGIAARIHLDADCYQRR